MTSPADRDEDDRLVAEVIEATDREDAALLAATTKTLAAIRREIERK